MVDIVDTKPAEQRQSVKNVHNSSSNQPSSPQGNTQTPPSQPDPFLEDTVNIDNIFQRQRIAYRKHPMPSARERIESIKQLKPALKKYCDPLCEALNQDFSNRHPTESQLAEIMVSVDSVGYHTKNIKKWMKQSRRHVSVLFQPASAKVIYQPVGVVGIIVPWNYPVYLAIGPLVSALAAGNRVMIKMSEYTPHTASVFKRMIGECFDEDQVAVITGEAEVGIAFSNIAFDHLLFTGSTAVGKHVMRAAANNLTPVTLELGGKSPVIISDSVPMKDAAERIAFGKCLNAGQTCVAPDYILCPDNRIDEFVSAFTTAVKKMYPSIKENNDYTAVINQRQLSRLKGYIEEAKSRGATVNEINPLNENFEDSQKLPVTLIQNVSDDMQVMQEEIFGPVLCIIGYDKLNDAINFVNDRPRPLALYYFDYNKENQNTVLEKTHSGGVCLNDTITHVATDDIPFGGIGPSGMGHYHGKEGFLTFSKAKGIVTKGKINSTKFALPPYNKPFHWVLRRLLK